VIALHASVLEDGQVGSLGVPETEQPGEGEVVLHRDINIIQFISTHT
jgi:hypothetical protein